MFQREGGGEYREGERAAVSSDVLYWPLRIVETCGHIQNNVPVTATSAY
jgi:hypothetical protein